MCLNPHTPLPSITQVLQVIHERTFGLNRVALLLILRLLATRLGTLLLAGAGCLTAHWPCVLAFPELPVAQRQAVLLSWAHSRLAVFRMVRVGAGLTAACPLMPPTHSRPAQPRARRRHACMARPPACHDPRPPARLGAGVRRVQVHGLCGRRLAAGPREWEQPLHGR